MPKRQLPEEPSTRRLAKSWNPSSGKLKAEPKPPDAVAATRQYLYYQPGKYCLSPLCGVAEQGNEAAACAADNQRAHRRAGQLAIADRGHSIGKTAFPH